MIPNTHGKRSSPSGGRIRSSCGYHHQRHQACHDTCEGRKTHPPGPHPPARDKFSVGCPSCQAYYSEQHQEILSPVSKRLTAQALTPPLLTIPETQLIPIHHSLNNSKFDEFTSIVISSTKSSPSSSPPHTPKLASLTHEVEYELLQQHHMDLSQKHRQYEQEEQLLLLYRQQLDKMRQQQDVERQRIQQQQQVSLSLLSPRLLPFSPRSISLISFPFLPFPPFFSPLFSHPVTYTSNRSLTTKNNNKTLSSTAFTSINSSWTMLEESKRTNVSSSNNNRLVPYLYHLILFNFSHIPFYLYINLLINHLFVVFYLNIF